MPNFPNSAFDCASLFVARIYSANKMALQRITINRDISFISFITGFYFHQGGVRSSALPPHLGRLQTFGSGSIFWKLPLEIPSLFNFVKKNSNLHYLRFFKY